MAPVGVGEHASDTGTAALSFPVLTLTPRCAFCVSCPAEFDSTIGILYETPPELVVASVTTVAEGLTRLQNFAALVFTFSERPGAIIKEHYSLCL
jgi:hypothetical protein